MPKQNYVYIISAQAYIFTSQHLNLSLSKHEARVILQFAQLHLFTITDTVHSHGNLSHQQCSLYNCRHSMLMYKTEC